MHHEKDVSLPLHNAAQTLTEVYDRVLAPSGLKVTQYVLLESILEDEAAQSLLEGVKRAGVKRMLVVGGAGTMNVAPGVRALDVIPIPEEWKPEIMAKIEE